MTEKEEEVLLLRHVRKVDDGVPNLGLSPIWLVFTESGVISQPLDPRPVNVLRARKYYRNSAKKM